MSSDKPEQPTVLFAYLRDSYEGLDGGLRATSILNNFEMRFLDYNRMRQYDIGIAAILNQDVGYLKEALSRQTPEFRAFILEAARLLLLAWYEEIIRSSENVPQAGRANHWEEGSTVR